MSFWQQAYGEACSSHSNSVAKKARKDRRSVYRSFIWARSLIVAGGVHWPQLLKNAADRISGLLSPRRRLITNVTNGLVLSQNGDTYGVNTFTFKLFSLQSTCDEELSRGVGVSGCQ